MPAVRRPHWDTPTDALPTTVRSHRAPHARREQLRRYLGLAAAVLFIAAVASWIPALGQHASSAQAADYTTPMTAVFLYDKSFRHANDHYQPSLTGYSDTNPAHVATQVTGMRYAGMDAAIMTWWGQGTHNETATMPVLYAQAGLQGLGVMPYYEPEGQGDTSLAQIQSDLAYLMAYVVAYPDAAVRIGGKPAIFVYNTSGGCARVTKWKQATHNFTDWYVNMKVFSGYKTCADQPSSWHQYGPAVAESVHLPYSFNISPGFWHHNEASPRLVRDPVRWASNVAHLKATTAAWRLVTSWNEWGEATSVESSPSWASLSGFGTYADELHNQLGGGVPAPTSSSSAPPAPSPSTTTTSPVPTPTGTTPVPSPSSCDDESNPLEPEDADEDGDVDCPGPTPTSSTASPTPSPTVSATPSPVPTTSTVPPSPSPTGSPTVSPSPSPTSPPPSPPPSGTVTVLAAGDIVGQASNGYGTSSSADGYTAELVTLLNPDAVLTLGDNQYEEGSLAQYQAGWGRTTCAAPGNCDAWGQHLGVMYPAPGNHEWLTANAQGYRDYFAARLAVVGSDTPSPNPQLYYSFDRGTWHFVSLDNDCSKVGGCNAGNPMMVWLLADLAANDGRPTVVYFHHPVWSSGQHGSTGGLGYLNGLLVADRDVQLVLSGHDHIYERFAPMGTTGPDPTGIRYFTAGTGGKNHTSCGTPIAGSAVCNGDTFGVLALTLSATGYSWAFHPISEAGASGNTFTDTGTSGLRPLVAAGAVAPMAVQQTTTAVVLARHTVVRGEYLSKIAAAMCGGASQWPSIWHANPQVHNPDLIFPGQVLAVPCATTTSRAPVQVSQAGWVSPLPGARCVSGWGAPRIGHTHKGIDLSRPSGIPIRAAHAGTVVLVRYQAGGAGWYVMLNHGTYQSVYMHMVRRSFLAVGAHVNAGQTIGYVGATGHASGPHLHFEVHRGAWHPFNPAPFLRSHGVAVRGC